MFARLFESIYENFFRPLVPWVAVILCIGALIVIIDKLIGSNKGEKIVIAILGTLVIGAIIFVACLLY